jgi:hypothetical protein
MVEVSDFGFIENFALESQLPFSVVGYITTDCNTYVPPPGYTVTECFRYSGNMVIGGTIHSDVSKIKVELQSGSSAGTIGVVIGVAIVAIIGYFALTRKYSIRKG